MKRLGPVFVILLLLRASPNTAAQFSAWRGTLPLAEGDLIPDVTGYTEEGEKLSLRTLKGHYTVLAFGCLT